MGVPEHDGWLISRQSGEERARHVLWPPAARESVGGGGGGVLSGRRLGMNMNVPRSARGGGIVITSSDSRHGRSQRAWTLEAGAPLRARGMELGCAHTLKVQRE